MAGRTTFSSVFLHLLVLSDLPHRLCAHPDSHLLRPLRGNPLPSVRCLTNHEGANFLHHRRDLVSLDGCCPPADCLLEAVHGAGPCLSGQAMSWPCCSPNPFSCSPVVPAGCHNYSLPARPRCPIVVRRGRQRRVGHPIIGNACWSTRRESFITRSQR